MGTFEEGHSGICCKVPKLPTSESRTPKVGWFSSKNPSSYLKVGRHQYGFMVGFPPTQKQYDSIWVVVYRLTKSSHFIPVKSTYSAEDYARIFINDIMLRHGISLSINHIGVHNSHLGFGGHSKVGWVPR